MDDVPGASPAGPYTRRIDQIDEAVFEGMKTVDQLTRKSINLYGDELCFGWREVFGQEEEAQPDGKVFKKVKYPFEVRFSHNSFSEQ